MKEDFKYKVGIKSDHWNYLKVSELNIHELLKILMKDTSIEKITIDKLKKEKEI